MTWHGLSFWIRDLRRLAEGLPRTDDLRQDAALLYVTGARAGAVPDAPESVNIAAMALTMTRLTVHQVSPAVVRRVGETDLHSLPDEAPRLLRGPWLLEVSDPSRERLVGATASLGGYSLDGVTYLVGLEWPDGAWVSQWRPTWGGVELAAGVPLERDTQLLVDTSAEELRDRAREAARLAVVLGLLLDAEGSPVVEGDPVPGTRGRRSPGRTKAAPEWVTRRVYLDGRRPAPRSPGEPTGAGLPPGRTAANVEVTGHLKRQPFGPGRTGRRWIYVESYEARRWVAPRPLRIVVSGAPDRQT